MTLQIVGDVAWGASFRPADRRITISFRTVEILWCAAYAYLDLV